MTEAQKLFEIWEKNQDNQSYRDLMILKRVRKKSLQVLGLTKDQVHQLTMFKLRRGL